MKLSKAIKIILAVCVIALLFAAVAYADSVDIIYGVGTVTTKDGSDLNIRALASGNSESLGLAPNSSKVLILRDAENKWYKVNYNGVVGYMHSDYITVASGLVEFNLGVGSVTGNNVNVRSSAGTSGSVVGKLNTDEKVSISAVDGQWYRISTEAGLSGYIRSDYVRLSTLEVAKASGESVTLNYGAGLITGSGVNLRNEPNTACKVVKVCPLNERVSVTGIEGDWFKVKCSNGTEGYIYCDYLSLENESTEASSYVVPAEYTPEELSIGQKIVETAEQYLGVPYVYGGTSPYGFDCSGLVYYVYRANGYSITRRASTIYYDGTPISQSELRVGDPVFFSNDYSTSIEHVGIYIGNGQFIHASSGGGKVRINNLSDSYYQRNYYGAVQIF